MRAFCCWSLAQGVLRFGSSAIRPFNRLVAWKWRCQIEAADDREAIAQVHRIAGLGEAGLPELAGLLGSERLCVAETARSGSGRRDATLARF